jgi:glycosyltransferase involved in cell wall biosynthesis
VPALLKISVLCSDLSDNAVGRADLLARLVRPLAEVEVIGPRHGSSLWAPVAEGDVAYRSIPGRRLPGFVLTMRELARIADGDLLYASKPRLASAGVGYLGRAVSGRPLLLDVDDWETGFFLRGGVWGTVGRALNFGNPKGLPWTWCMERLVPFASGITVASRFLQERFGGVLVPHVRDTDRWSPELADPEPARRQLGLGAERVVMFLGTPREHKGVGDLAAAVRRLGRPGVVLAVVGAEPGGPAARRLAVECPGVLLAGPVSFAEVPSFLAAADVVAIPQRDTSDTRGQVPAKLFDAMALGRPIVSTRVSMIAEVLDGCGLVVEPGDAGALAEAIGWLLDHRDEARALGAQARARCVERYSFASARETLFPLVTRVLRR